MEKYSEQLKVEAVETYRSGELGLRATAQHHNVGVSSLRKWVAAYEANGVAGLQRKHKQVYDVRFKLAVLQRIKNEGLSYRQAAALFDIRRFDIITAWELAYKKDGMAGLVPHRTTPCSGSKDDEPSPPPRDDEARTRQELLDELAALRTENAYLKKLDALVQAQAKSARGKERRS